MLGLKPMLSGMVGHSLIVLKPLCIGDPKMTLKDFQREHSRVQVFLLCLFFLVLIQAILSNFASPNPAVVQLLCTSSDMEEFIHINNYKEGRIFSLLFDLGFTLKPQNLPISWILQGLKTQKMGHFFIC